MSLEACGTVGGESSGNGRGTGVRVGLVDGG